MYFLSVVSAFGPEYGQIEPHQAGQSEESLKGQLFVPSDRGRLVSVKLDLAATAEFLGVIEKGCFVRNPYHNVMHTVDVMQAMLTLLMATTCPDFFSAQELQAGLIAAAIHDYEYPGVDSSFLVNIRHPMAIRYSDSAILENHHVAAAFALLSDMDVNPMANYSE
ncbi:calcium/calmodulin-dependent 3',5'-cyclic nucleotide phosphodiesterase, putative, partial [Perkinsus marinus ATCC 50983]